MKTMTSGPFALVLLAASCPSAVAGASRAPTPRATSDVAPGLIQKVGSTRTSTPSSRST